MRTVIAALLSIASSGALAVELSTEQLSVLTHEMNDPASAQVREVRASSEHDGVFCGEVNWRNSAGGYDGFRAFWLDMEERQSAVAPHPSYAAFAEAMGCN